jgi:hypothetical protein
VSESNDVKFLYNTECYSSPQLEIFKIALKALTCGYRRHLKKLLINTFITNENLIYVKYSAFEINIQLLDKFNNLSNVTQVLKQGQISISTKISFLNNFRKNEVNKILSFSA